MHVFLTWSGDQSKAVAQTLEVWLRRLLQTVEPWISTEIGKGVRWSPEVTARLRKSKVGICCLTRTNLTEPWINFEAGAISNTEGALVCTFLLDLAPSEVPQPLGQFQHTVATEEDVRRLVHSINTAAALCEEHHVQERDLDETFKLFWPQLRAKLEEIKAASVPAKKHRTDREILEEMLELLRGQVRRAVVVRGPHEGDVRQVRGQLYVHAAGRWRPAKGTWVMFDGKWVRVDTQAASHQDLAPTSVEAQPPNTDAEVPSAPS